MPENNGEIIHLLQNTEREIDKVISNLNHINDKRLKLAIDRLYDLSLEFNTRIDHLKTVN